MEIKIGRQRFKQLTALDSRIKTINEARRKARQFENHAVYLRQVREDLAREEHYGVKIVYFIDFSIIRGFLHPVEASAPTPLKSAFLLRNSKKDMVISAGALYELLEYMDFLSKQIKTKLRTTIPRWEEFRSSSLVSDFVRSIDKEQGTQEISAKLVSLCREMPPVKNLISDLGFLPETSKAIKKLNWLLENKLTPLKDIIPLKDLDIDESAYNKSLMQLTAERQKLSKNNHLDALNFALTQGLNNRFFESKSLYFVYMTHGAPYYTLSSTLWENDPMKDEETLLGFKIVRELVYSSHATLAEAWFQKLAIRIRFIGEALLHCIVRAHELSVLCQTLQDGQIPMFDAERAMVERPADILAIQYREPWAPDVINEYVSLLDKQAQEEQQFHHAKKTLDEQLIREGVSKAERMFEEGWKAKDELQNEWGRLNAKMDEIRHKLETQIESLQQTAVTSYFIPPMEEVELSEFTVSDLRRGNLIDEFEIKGKRTGEVVCSLRLGPYFYSAESLTRAGNLDWFCRVATYLVKQTSLNGNPNPLRFREIEKTPEGIVISTTKGELWVHEGLQDMLPLQANELWRMVTDECEGFPKYIRINSPFMDIWYEFITESLREGRAGIHSHLSIPYLVAYFVARSKRRLVRIDLLAKKLEEVLGDRYPLYDEAPLEKERGRISKTEVEKMIEDNWDMGLEVAQSHGLQVGRTPYYKDAWQRYRENFYRLLEERYVIED